MMKLLLVNLLNECACEKQYEYLWSFIRERELSSQQRQQLLRWYKRIRRDLPWRQTQDPYRILVSEVMLQQTQVDRVIPFYHRFMETFPNEQALADADITHVHRLWKGLGYPSRAERLQKTCQIITRERDGQWPQTAEGLQELPGIGPYTSAAVACFACGQSVPLVDTNVARVYARRDALPIPLDKKLIWQHAENHLARRSAVAYNNALMELGALVCTARNPTCDECPWKNSCQTLAQNPTETTCEEEFKQTANPMKVASAKVQYGVTISDKKKTRKHIVLALIHHEGKYLIAKRPPSVHMGNYWELPGGKKEKGEDDRIALAREIDEELGAEILSARPFVTFTYEYPEFYLTFHCYRCRLFHPELVQPLAATEIKWVTPEEFMAYEFPPANEAIKQRFQRYHFKK